MSSAYLQRPVVGFHHQRRNSEENRCSAAVHSHSEKASLSLLGHLAWMPESSDTRSLLVANVLADWRHPRGRPRSVLLRTVRADLDLIDTSLEGAISIAKDTETDD